MSTLTAYREDGGTLAYYAWPGGYPLFYITEDCGVLCPACANGENGSEATDVRTADPQWRLVAAETNWEDPALYCDHCSARIESAYAEDQGEDMAEGAR